MSFDAPNPTGLTGQCDFPLISARGLSKRYEVSAGAGSLSRGVGGKDVKGDKTALFPIDLDICPGESVGIFGRNGAGKSTLLSLLSETISPSTGTVETRGTLAPLLQLTAWLDLEETGRENVEAFAALNGLTGRYRRELVSKAQSFANIGKFFDAPVRTYSSGMVARLAFGAAINVSADTILIDEIIAVGDSSFRSRCYAALREKVDSGKSLIIVSQSPGAIMNVTTRGIVLDKGRLVFDGDIQVAADVYSDIIRDNEKMGGRLLEGFDDLIVNEMATKNGSRDIKIRIANLSAGEEYNVAVDFTHHRNIKIGTLHSVLRASDDGVVIYRIPVPSHLNTATYLLSFMVTDPNTGNVIRHFPRAFRLDIANNNQSIGIADLNLNIRMCD